MSASRESQWLVLRRCLAIIRRLERGPTGRMHLIEAVYESEGRDAYGNVEDKALGKRFENDLKRIREQLDVEIRYGRKERAYVLQDTWLPLLDLPDEDLATIAWLDDTFGLDSPKHDEVHALLGRLRSWLDINRRAEIERQRGMLSVDLTRRDEHEIPEGVWARLLDVLERRCQVEFLYGSPQQTDKTPRRHVAEFYNEPYFDDGHYYIRGYCRYTDGPLGKNTMRRYFNYRLDRISDISVLPTKLPPYPPRPKTYEVVYELSADVARKGVSRPRWVTSHDVERRPDGSAVVRGETEDLFRTLQALMRYRHHCRVLGGVELLGEMKEVVRKMGEMYEDGT
ncbi:MAG: WYL domain-containing protein [Chloroflexi bacterium]|nr:WYL domain-containing protein [Chloroflexota bacterium]